MQRRIFLLSPASCGGKRAALLFNPRADFTVAQRVRSEEGAPLGEVFSFLSGLYFRGKKAYAEAFGREFDELCQELGVRGRGGGERAAS